MCLKEVLDNVNEYLEKYFKSNDRIVAIYSTKGLRNVSITINTICTFTKKCKTKNKYNIRSQFGRIIHSSIGNNY